MTTIALEPRQTRFFAEPVMGLEIGIHVDAEGPDRSEVHSAVAAAFAHLRRVEEVLSPWRSDSDLIRVRRGLLRWGQADPWLTEVERLCTRAEQATAGLFTSTLRGPDHTVGFDPTGLAKGWAVAGAVAQLRSVPDMAWTVQAGADTLSEDHAGQVVASATCSNASNVVDPRTGRRVWREGSVTVTGADLVQADVWATALWVDPSAWRDLELQDAASEVRWTR